MNTMKTEDRVSNRVSDERGSRRKETMAASPFEPPGFLSAESWMEVLIWLDYHMRLPPWEVVSAPDNKTRGGPLAPNSLFLFSINHPIRKPCIRLARWKMLEWLMLVVILCNCVALAMETNRPGFRESTLGKELVVANYFFIAIFTIEMIIKVIGLGFVVGEHTYLRNGWNVMDFIIVVFAWLGLVPAFGSYTFMRCARVLRPLRLITQIESLRNLVVSVLLSLPMLINVVILVLFFYAIFGIASVELFRGRMSYRCAAPDPSSFIPSNLVNGTYRNVSYMVDLNDFTQSTWPCVGPMASSITWRDVSGSPVPSVLTEGGPSSPATVGRVCPSVPSNNPNDPNTPYGLFCVPYANPTPLGNYRHYDNILTAWLAVFQHTAPQDWSSIMYDEWDGLIWWTWPYDIVMVIIGGLLIQNLTLAILFLNFTKNYHRISKQREIDKAKSDMSYASYAASSREMRMNATMTKGGMKNPRPRSKPTTSSWSFLRPLWGPWEALRDLCFEVQDSKAFQVATTLAIIGNAVVLAMVWFPNYPKSVNIAVINLNYAFTMTFLLEMLIKLLALGVPRYASDSYNLFDGCITTAGVVVMILELRGVQSTGLTSLRALRLLLLFRLAKSWKSLNRMIAVMIISIKSVAWLTVLLVLFIFVTAILGMFIFGYKMDSCPVEGSRQLCPPGLTWRDCPDHFDCYVPCSPSQVFSWISVPGSPYNNQSYCEAFPRTGLKSIPSAPTNSSTAAPSPPPAAFSVSEYASSVELAMMNASTQYWAQVGKPLCPLFTQNPSYDYFYQAFLAVFVLLTQDNWAENCHWLMQITSPWAALFVVIVLVLGVFILLSLFLAVLIANLDDSNGVGEEESQSIRPTSDSGKGDMKIQQVETQEQPLPLPLYPEVPETPVKTAASIDYAALSSSPLPPASPPAGMPNLSKPRARTKLPPLAARPALPPAHQAPAPLSAPNTPSKSPLPSSESEASVAQEDHTVPKRDEGKGSHGHVFFGTWGNKVVPLNENVDKAMEMKGRASAKGHDWMGQRSESWKSPLLEIEAEEDRSRDKGWLRKVWERDASLFIFGPKNPLRAFLHRLIEYPEFEYAMLAIILLSCLELCFDDSTVEDGTPMYNILFNLNCMFAAIFCVEVVVKIIALGLIFNGRESYLRSGWNGLDLCIAAVSVAIVVFQATSNSNNIVWLRAMRSLRALRPLRFARRMDGFNAVCIAIGQALPVVSEVVLIGVIFYFVFAVTAVNLMAGTFQFCASPSNPSPVNGILDPYYFLPQGININRSWCEAGGTGTVNVTTSYYHSSLNLAQPFPSYQMTTQWGANGILPRFDNVIMALWVLFQIASLENWNNIMYFAMWTSYVDWQPFLYSFTNISIFFAFFVVFGVWLILNMVIGVSINGFNQMRKKNGRFSFLTEKQQEWVLLQRILLFSKPKTKYQKPKNPVRAFAFSVCMNEQFNFFMIAIILANTAMMCLSYQGMSSRLSQALIISNAIFTVIYVMEMLLRWMAMGLGPYFANRWCQFDFFVVVVSVISVGLDFSTDNTLTVFTVLRVARVLRIIKIVPRARGLRMMLLILWWSLPALGNVASVLFIVLFIYSIVGMNIFGFVRSDQQYLDEHANFQTFARSILMLLRFSTGENWNSVMYDTMIEEQCILVTQTVNITLLGTNTTIWLGTYLDSIADSATLTLIPSSQKMNKCTPSPIITAIYFCSYLMLVIFLLLQLIISVLIENIENLSKMEEMQVSYNHVDSFVRVWEEIDVMGSGFIKASEVTSLLMKVNRPLGVKTPPGEKEEGHCLLKISDIIRDLDLPLRNKNQQVHFLECLHALAKNVAGVKFPEEDDFELHGQLVARLPKDTDDSKTNFTLLHWYSADHVKASIRGFLIRREMWNVEGTSVQENAREIARKMQLRASKAGTEIV